MMPFSEKTLTALGIAVRDEEPIADLEFIGVSPRTLSILQKNGINTMDQLMHKTQEELHEIKSISTRSVSQLMTCLQNYHELSSKLGVSLTSFE
jgi:DNA-directed RNA polymerase alpha subunit